MPVAKTAQPNAASVRGAATWRTHARSAGKDSLIVASLCRVVGLRLARCARA
jgi:hypothetical protein